MSILIIKVVGFSKNSALLHQQIVIIVKAARAIPPAPAELGGAASDSSDFFLMTGNSQPRLMEKSTLGLELASSGVSLTLCVGVTRQRQHIVRDCCLLLLALAPTSSDSNRFCKQSVSLSTWGSLTAVRVLTNSKKI